MRSREPYADSFGTRFSCGAASLAVLVHGVL
jgi:hypothetical protein